MRFNCGDNEADVFFAVLRGNKNWCGQQGGLAGHATWARSRLMVEVVGPHGRVGLHGRLGPHVHGPHALGPQVELGQTYI